MKAKAFVRSWIVLAVAMIAGSAVCEQKLELQSKRMKEPNEVAFCGSLFQPTAVLCRGETQDSLSLLGPDGKSTGRLAVTEEGKDHPRVGADCSRNGRYVAVSRRADPSNAYSQSTDVWDVVTQSKRWTRTGSYARPFITDNGAVVFAIADSFHEYLIEFFGNTGKRLERVGPLRFLDGRFALDPSGRCFLAATGDPKEPSRIALYDMSGKETAGIEAKRGHVVSLGIAPGSSRIVVFLWDTMPGAAVRETLMVLNDQLDTVLSESDTDTPWGELAFSADAYCFALAGRSHAQLRKSADGVVIWRLDVSSLAGPGEETLVREIVPSRNGKFTAVVLATRVKGAKEPRSRYSLALVDETGHVGRPISLDTMGGAVLRMELSADESQVALEREKSIERYSIRQ